MVFEHKYILRLKLSFSNRCGFHKLLTNLLLFSTNFKHNSIKYLGTLR